MAGDAHVVERGHGVGRLAGALRRELARRLSGDAAAVRIALEGDPVLARALAVLGRARTVLHQLLGAGDGGLPGQDLLDERVIGAYLGTAPAGGHDA